MMNYKHLHYFWTVAKEGSVTKASQRLHLTPQTISGQLSLLEEYYSVKLFNKVGRSLELSEVGNQVMSYADEIFSLGNELEQMLLDLPAVRPQLLKVGIVDVLAKSITHQILLPALTDEQSIRLDCREADLDSLLAELTLHRLDLVIADRAIPETVSMRGVSHKLGQSSMSFFATPELKAQLKGPFPECLNNAPMLLPNTHNELSSHIEQWLTKHHIKPRIIAEFDDSALMKAFGQEGVGVFNAPSVIEHEVEQENNVIAIGKTDEIIEEFYAIYVEKRVNPPILKELIKRASNALFA
ncbi:transcriptional activator NhaR [Methylophaga sulfidovorans]|uniref:Transcriptional regulator, LysR family n=1 Tax=Methylophaga sulfidovorans TaxID=45496 RepID=A0A1I3U7S1_9GAMM|nr:transcriptional activator NhaR [Methylophaga sulfidovorans]SFJ77896.1 transcriptional regulator, LysR family [Methylophaga sulfidovorans]